MSAEGSSADGAFREFVDQAIPFPDGPDPLAARRAQVFDENGVLDRSAFIVGDHPPQPFVVEECSTPELIRLVEQFGPRLSLGDLFRIHDAAAGRLRTSDADDAARLQQLLRQLLEETALRGRSP
jgi:hypothetical protein